MALLRVFVKQHLIYHKCMNMLRTMVFAGEIVFHIKIVERAMHSLMNDMDDLDYIDIWSNVQQVLVSSSNISKIFWPPNKKNNKRGRALRELFNVGDNSPLNNRVIRNHFEHFDERIEKYFQHTDQGVYTDLEIILPMPEWAYMGSTRNRAYDPVNHIVMFRNEKLELQPIFIALQEIKVQCSNYTIV